MTNKADASQALKAAQLVACPGVLLCAPLLPRDGDKTAASTQTPSKSRVMISTLSYASLSPLIFASNLASTSRTGQDIIAAGLTVASVLAQHHRPMIEALAAAQNSKQKVDDANILLQECGFQTAQYETPAGQLPYIKDAAVALYLTLHSSQNLPESILALLEFGALLCFDETMPPLIRYNRNWIVTALSNVQSQYGSDKYPV
ncbi:MAG: flavin reductase family protein [Candidatus Obscuribacterales bacterium]|nr:flavin reductase family protein [Candidatus Obscuribacterales bacterium]